jgi:hypothetical protein
MKIVFSRHAKRRMSLYDIPEAAVLAILQNNDQPDDSREIIGMVEGFDLPVKVVFTKENDYYIVVTAYPLKRGRDESIL